MRIGVDFDNTIVCYDDVFHRAAVERGLISAETARNKGAVRNSLRGAGMEPEWTLLQGLVYGARMQEADAFPGVVDFFRRSRHRGIEVYIVSHKTRHPFRGPEYDLHAAANRWLEAGGFYDSTEVGLPREAVFFEDTKVRKLERIRDLGCTHFIDDLPEFLSDPGFPPAVQRLLFHPTGSRPSGFPHLSATDWTQISRMLL